MDYKIITGKTLEQYNRKFKYCRKHLVCYTKDEVKAFDKKFGKENNFLLRGRNWCLIGDTYYEMPALFTWAWFRSLNSTVQIFTTGIATVGLASAVVFPTLAATVWKKGGDSPTPGPEPEPTKEWYEDKTYINSLTENDVTKEGGTIKELTVNGVSHKVRLIGINHDKFEDDSEAHTTWEFANFICDSNGNSLAYQWNDTNTTPINEDFSKSTIRYALTGEGENGGKTGEIKTQILCVQKNETSWSSIYGNNTVLSMLPKNLQSVLKPVKKKIRIGTSGATPFEFSDKLFLLSGREKGFNLSTDEGTPYKYYETATTQISPLRIIKQINNDEIFNTIKQIPMGKGQTYQDLISSYAGWNQSLDDTYGGYYFSRSRTSNNTNCYYFGPNGGIGGQNVSTFAYSICPAFCL